MKKKFTINDIKSGYIVKLRNGVFMYTLRVNQDKFTKIITNGRDDWMYLSRYDYDLKCDGDRRFLDIMEVYGLIEGTNNYARCGFLDNNHRPLLWKRSEPVKMTVEEINKKLGYEVEIVASK